MNAVTKADLFAQANGNGRGIASQATHIEQSRAVAQVQAALVVAKSVPRDALAAGERMREACENQVLAEHAFYSYSRGDGKIAGPSIHLAVELARCWGNIEYGVSELRRDDGESEMLAYSWDQETNTKVQSTFIVPHKRDTKNGLKDLTDMRDIYENNANNGARRLRECIFRVLPKAFVEEAKSICGNTLEHGGGVPIEKRREQLLQAFTDLGVSRKRLEAKVGRAADKLTGYDIGVLRVTYQSIRRGETTVAEEFPDDTAGQAMQELKARAAQKPAAKPETTDYDPATGEVNEVPAQETPPPAEQPHDPAAQPPAPEATRAAGDAPARQWTAADARKRGDEIAAALRDHSGNLDNLKDTWAMFKAEIGTMPASAKKGLETVYSAEYGKLHVTDERQPALIDQ